jgi:mitogen-activated protein kinase 1/3
MGAFGLVLGVRDSKGRMLAIKKVADAFDDVVNGKRLLREVMVMQHVHHRNVLSLRNLYMGEDNNSVYIVSNLLHSNLKRLIQFDLKKLSQQHIKYILYQVLLGLQYIHACGLLHR